MAAQLGAAPPIFKMYRNLSILRRPEAAVAAQTTTTVATTIHNNGYIQWQKKLERRIHSLRGDVFMNRKTNGINYIADCLEL
jgi:hypothetical protein